MPGFTQLCLKAEVVHEELVILLPYGVAFLVAADHDAPHVVREDLVRDPEMEERVDHPDKQVFLLRIRKELHVPFPAGMTDHDKTGDLIRITIGRFHGHKAPVHLVAFARRSNVTPAAVSLRGNDLTPGREQVFMRRHIPLYGRLAPGIPAFLQTVIDDGGILDPL